MSDAEVKRMKEKLGLTREQLHDLKGGINASKRDFYKKPNGDIVVKPKNGKGPGEPTGLNIKNI
ncbi:MAG: hypothetical protein EA390_13715 [Balneolaceae bacterium]|nr:MAG: hypothetical protein EA390_13715 [Balneolaceae bacterium]